MKKFKLPKAVKVKDEEWRVVLVPGLSLNGVEVLGVCCWATKTISIEKHIKHEEKIVTLAHEILHAWAFTYDFPLTHKVIEKLEEPFAEFLSSASFLY